MTLSFSHTDQQFESVKKATVQALQTIFPVEGKLRKVVMDKVWVEDNLDATDYQGQLKTKQNEGTWGVPVYASLKLIDAQGKTVDANNKLRLFNLPKPTTRHSYIVGGNEYQVSNQLRLKSGVYTIRKQNGELKSQINLSRGKNFDLAFDESKGIFFIKKVAGGQANIPLYPILIHLGFTPAEVAKYWGNDLTTANSAGSDNKAVDKLYVALGIKKGTLQEYLKTTAIDPETTKAALGKSFDKVDGQLLLAASKNLLETHLGKTPPTDRDSLEYKELHSVDDFMKERLEKNAGNLASRVKRSVDNLKRTKLTQIVNPGIFGATVESFFITDDKAATSEQTNPLEMLSGTTRVTTMGAGGIGSTHAITNEMRQVHPSHFGLIDVIHSPESDKTGVNLHLPLGAIKDGKDLRVVVLDQKGKQTTLSANEAKNKKIVFPGQKGDTVKAMYQGNVIEIPKKQGDYFIPSSSNLFTWSTNLIPFLPSAQGNRAMMAAKMMEQSISLKHREAPLVQSLAPSGKTFEETVGEQASVKSPADGVVKQVTDNSITIKTKAGDVVVNIYHNFPLNRKSFIHMVSLVKKGEAVKTGQLIADSNYTKGGVLALGTNLRTAYVAYKGLNHDDGIVISESCAEKLTSEHIYKKDMPIYDNIVMGLGAFKSFYPTTITPKNLAKMDNDGFIKKGEIVSPGDIIIAAMQKRTVSSEVSRISRVLSERPKDVSVVWTLEDSGVVLDVLRSPKSVTVVIKTEEQAKIGDKLAGRHGNKGVITRILPDKEMPYDSQKKPMEILLNPMGIVSRINISQTYESTAGKVSNQALNGKPVVVDNFDGTDNLETVSKLMKKTGVNDKEKLFDATTGKSLGEVHVGMPHILKLFKQSQGNYSIRQGGPGHGYDANMQPLKAGGEEGAKAMDALTIYSMLSHGATANLREMASIKNSKNDDFWKALKSGEMLPPPAPSYAFNKFTTYLQGAGIDIKKEGTKMILAPFTDKQIKENSNYAIKEPVFYTAKTFEPKSGGFFDPVKMGGFKGNKWGHLELAEPVVNPPFENAVRKLTGLGKKFNDVVAGKLFITKTGELNSDGKGVTGGHAIAQMLNNIDVKDEITMLTNKSKKAKGAVLDDINKKLKYLTALKALDMKPAEAYLRSVVPVIPSQFRPIYPMPDGQMTTSDVNFYYKNLGILNKMMKQPVMDLLDDSHKEEIRTDLYQHVKGLSGLTDVNIQGQPREGFISEIKGGTGGQPKEGYFISKLFSKKQDYVGRGTIIPDTSLGIDEMAMPEAMAWKLFEPFIVRELKNHGKSPLQAMEEIKQKSSLARKALELVMAKRHVLLNRAPSLHKYSIMAFKPKITDGKALKIAPLVNKGFNADYNGDSVAAHVNLNIRYLTENNKWLYCSCRADQLFETILDKTISQMADEAKGFTAIYEIEEGKLQTMSYEDGRAFWTDVKQMTVHTSHGPCFKVKTHTGTELTATEHHNFSYIGSDLEMHCVKTDVMPTNVLIPKAVPVIEDTGIQKIKIGDKELLVDEDMAWLLGHYAGDGSVSKGTVSFCDTKPYILDRVENIIQRKFGFKNRRQSTAQTKDCLVRIYNKTYHSWFESNCGKGCEGKIVPAFILTSPEHIRLSYFAGLFEAEGSISSDSNNNYIMRIEMISRSFLESVRYLLASCGIGSYIVYSGKKGRDYYKVNIRKADFHKVRYLAGDKLKKYELALSALKNNIHKDCYDIVPLTLELLSELSFIGKQMRGKSATVWQRVEEWRKTTPGRLVKLADLTKENTSTISRHIAEDLIHTYGALGSSYFKKWSEIVSNRAIQWELVEEIKQVPREEVMFDFSVPKGEVFSCQNGILTHNTMIVHAPITEEANLEAAKMLPSKNLFQIGTGNLMIVPSQEAQIGLFYLSKTPSGRDVLNKIIGHDIKVTEVLDKKKSAELLMRIAKTLTGQEYADIVHRLKAEGEKHAYETGFTIGINDLHSFEKERKPLLAAAKEMLKTEDASVVSGKISALADKAISHRLKDKDNPLFDQIESGAKGSASQLRSIMFSPLFMADAKGKTMKTPISKSYAEGLSMADYWAASYGARTGTIGRAISTSQPGAFSKDILATTIDNVISKLDCGTKDGIVLPITSNDLLERYTAGEQGNIHHNTLVDSNLVNQLKKSGKESLRVRSPLKCLAPRGTCAHCYGLDEHGHLPEVGENVGAKTGQSISEPLTQLAMNAFHTGGVAGTGAQVGGFKRINQLLSLPKILSGAAALATTSGKVTKISKSSAGGYDVHIGDNKMRIVQGRKPLVEVGDHVEKGDSLSDGPIKPQELTELKGVEHAQNYITSELQKTYKDQGVGINRKTFETVVRSLTNTTQVLKPAAGMSWQAGDIIPLTVANHYNANLITNVPCDEAVNHKLAEGVGSMRAGHILTQSEANGLLNAGVHEVKIVREELDHKPFVKGMQNLPLMRQDWMAALGYRNLSKVLTEGAAQGWQTDIESYHPIPGLAMGTTFGKGKEGKY